MDTQPEADANQTYVQEMRSQDQVISLSQFAIPYSPVLFVCLLTCTPRGVFVAMS